MNKTFAKVLGIASLLLALYALAAMVATFTQLAQAADRIHAGAGQPLFWLLVALFTALIVYPLILLLRLPKAMQPPQADSAAELAGYQAWLQRHLAQHPRPEVSALAAGGDVAGALQLLGNDADALIRNTAGNVFVSTALIQNGRLDGLVLLSTQLRLVWQIAALHRLRPSPRQLWYLYANVGGTMLVASNLQELDFAEIAGPIVHSAAPSVIASVPGMQGIGNLLVNSMANGAANAFLTLRVGLIAKSYCAPRARPDRSAVRRSATLAALAMLSGITQEKGAQIAKGIWSGVTGSVTQAAASVAEGARRTGSAAGSKVADAGKAMAAKAASATDAVGTFSRDAALSAADAVGNAGAKTAQMGRSTAQGIAKAADRISLTTGGVLDATASRLARKDKATRRNDGPPAR